ncbi:hypothetical protein OF83DRAFT_1258997 [Amylostereum chailletii]|nr:hypothetical protein OF83DRAFT_1258997 [Amylostereum chailletii]
MFASHPNRALLNPKFEGYKLDPIVQEDVIHSYPLQYKPSQATVSGKVPLSFHEVQSRIRHNHIVLDAEHRQAVYVDSDLRVVRIKFDDALRPTFDVVYDMPEPIYTENAERPQREYASAAFFDESTLFVSDGYGLLYVLALSPTSPAILLETYILPDAVPATDSVTTRPFRIHALGKTSETTVTVVLSSKYSTNGEKSTTSARKPPTPLYDIYGINIDSTTAPDSNGVPLTMNVSWHRRGQDPPLYTAYEPTQTAFLFAGGAPYCIPDQPTTVPPDPSPDEIVPIPREGEAFDAPRGPEKPPPYAWTQDNEELTIAFPLPFTTAKSNMTVHLSQQTLTVLVRDAPSDAALHLPHHSAARLWGGISPSSSFWTWDAQGEHKFGLLMLHLEKQHAGTRWPHIFDASIQEAEVPETLDPSELAQIRESLEKYTAALQEGRDMSGLGLGSGVPSSMEGEMDDEADAAVGSAACLTWVGADGSSPTWACEDASMPFTVLSTPLPGADRNSISFTVKHTIDGLLYTFLPPDDVNDTPTWKHTTTYSALAFVLASKRDTRFMHHVPGRAVLAFEGGGADYGGNLYVYRDAPPKALWAKQAILKLGGGEAGAVLGVGSLSDATGRPAIVCLCEGVLIVLRDVL